MNRNLCIILLCLTALLLNPQAKSQSQQTITGTWITIDDDGKTAKSHVAIWYDGKEYKGKIVSIIEEEKRDSKCTKCSENDPRYNQPVLGMTIITGVKKTGENEWGKGEILDPNNGSVYDCKLRIDDNGNLIVRGYLGLSLLGRSQTWIKKKE